jgi:3-hydroxyisobutyrate dehydrogenase-like beta-hydroxyacid dehydrogenase
MTPDHHQERAPVTVAGLGPMGQALADAFLAAGHPTTVWNRTAGRAAALRDRGATEADTIDQAFGAGTIVVICVRDYDAVRDLLDMVQLDWTGRTLVNLTSGAPDQARRLAEWAGARQISYLDGAILTPTPTIATPAARVIYSGSSDAYASARGTLSAISSQPIYLDHNPSAANSYDTALLDIFHTTVHGIVHGFALVTAEGIRGGQFAPFATGIASLLPEMVTRFAAQLDAGSHPGERSTIASSRASIRHIIDTADQHGIDTGALHAALAVIDRATAEGHGGDGLSYLATALGHND